jgi:YcxB-like protein
MTTTMTDQPLRFEIAPLPGESTRSCVALIGRVSKSRGAWFLFGLYAGVGLLSYLLPPSRLASSLVGFVAVFASIYGLQAVGRANIRAIQSTDPHSLETYVVEVGPHDVFTGCAHVNARYPWKEFSKVFENDEFYLFLRSTGGGAAIPKRILDGEAEQQLRNRISEWSPDRGAGLARERGAGAT